MLPSPHAYVRTAQGFMGHDMVDCATLVGQHCLMILRTFNAIRSFLLEVVSSLQVQVVPRC